MTTIKKLVLFIATTVLFTSCKMNKGCAESLNGTLVNLTLDGCSWVIELDNNKKIIPINLDSFDIEKEDDVKVSITYNLLDDVAGICMTGKMAELSCIQKINN